VALGTNAATTFLKTIGNAAPMRRYVRALCPFGSNHNQEPTPEEAITKGVTTQYPADFSNALYLAAVSLVLASYQKSNSWRKAPKAPIRIATVLALILAFFALVKSPMGEEVYHSGQHSRAVETSKKSQIMRD
jgi:hypothetical protein